MNIINNVQEIKILGYENQTVQYENHDQRSKIVYKKILSSINIPAINHQNFQLNYIKDNKKTNIFKRLEESNQAYAAKSLFNKDSKQHNNEIIIIAHQNLYKKKLDFGDANFNMNDNPNIIKDTRLRLPIFKKIASMPMQINDPLCNNPLEIEPSDLSDEIFKHELKSFPNNSNLGIMMTEETKLSELKEDMLFPELNRYPEIPRELQSTNNANGNYISSETMNELLLSSNQNKPERNFLIIDCRFDYEYQGGHIKGALNINSRQLLHKLLFSFGQNLSYNDYINDLKQNFNNITYNMFEYPANYLIKNSDKNGQTKPPIIIFHCEFSQYRAPKICNFLRNYDREINLNNYPKLCYPELYILEGGYHKFHSKYPEHCVPNMGYIQMENMSYIDQMEVNLAKFIREWDKKKSKTLPYPKFNLQKNILAI